MLVLPCCVSLFASQSVCLCHAIPIVVEPAVRALSTRSANRPPVTAVPVVKDKPKDKAAGIHSAKARVQAVFFILFYFLTVVRANRGRLCCSRKPLLIMLNISTQPQM